MPFWSNINNFTLETTEIWLKKNHIDDILWTCYFTFIPTPSHCSRHKTQLVETTSHKMRKNFKNQDKHCWKFQKENAFIYSLHNYEKRKNTSVAPKFPSVRQAFSKMPGYSITSNTQTSLKFYKFCELTTAKSKDCYLYPSQIPGTLTSQNPHCASQPFTIISTPTHWNPTPDIASSP